ncbi:UmoD family flagellar biogenesis regulator [Providencia alcalifaciens]|uniref:UmoD family flagellar biogenesis regulator n=1 Tax=Providencia alcalifaciens TaxID=126385 RepID=UPI0032DBD66E
MKLKIKLLLAAFVAVCLIVVGYFSFVRSDELKIATVLSTEPIRATRMIKHENCSVTGILGSFTQESLSRWHPAQRECRTILMIQSLQGKSFPPFSSHEPRTCVITKSLEQIIVGYDVIYRIGDTIGKVRMPYEPTVFIPLNENGQLDLTISSNAACETLREGTKDILPFYCMKPNDLPKSYQPSTILEVKTGKNTFGLFE